MPDTSTFSTQERDALNRVFDLRRRAAQHRRLAENSYFPADWLFSATKFDSQADIILEAMKRGKTVPKVDFGNEPFRG